jgi:hypothetical protein
MANETRKPSLIDFSPKTGIIRFGVKRPLMLIFDPTRKFRPSYVIAVIGTLTFRVRA